MKFWWAYALAALALLLLLSRKRLAAPSSPLPIAGTGPAINPPVAGLPQPEPQFNPNPYLGDLPPALTGLLGHA